MSKFQDRFSLYVVHRHSVPELVWCDYCETVDFVYTSHSKKKKEEEEEEERPQQDCYPL